MSNETTLLPCPFCGGEAEICHVRDICQDPQDWYWGKCPTCYMSGKTYPTEAEAIAAWNTRAELGSEPPYDELLRCLENDWHIRASWDGLRKFWCVELTEEGVRMRDATHGTLTAEQVRKAIFIGSVYANYDGAQYYASGINMHAIADELNARAERTCEMGENGNCSNCGEFIAKSWEYVHRFDGEHVARPTMAHSYCPSCGARVRDE